MGLRDFLVRITGTPADKRLRAAAAEAFFSAPTPAPSGAMVLRAGAGPFGGSIRPPGNPPPIDYWNDQMAPAGSYTHRPGYTDHTYQAMSAPLGFEGWDLDRIRHAVAQHSIGYFWHSSLLCHVLLRFGPMLAALQQAVAPIASLPRHLHGGDKGLAKMVAAELEDALLPARGLLPSPYLPPTLIPTLASVLRLMGAGTLQHVDGDMDPYSGVRPRFTRIWPEWAINCYRSPRKIIALTTEGPVEVQNDGKFTRVQDEDEGYLSGAVVALGDQVFAGKIVQGAQLSFLDFFGKPKLWAKLPPKIQPNSAAGNDFLAATMELFGPDGFGIFPDGTELATVSLNGTGADKFTPALAAAVAYIYMILTGSTGTMGPGGPTGEGPYQAKEGGFWNVRHDLMERPVRAILTAINGGHIQPYCVGNYGDLIKSAERVKAWSWPRMTIPMVAPDRDARIAALAEREKMREDRIERRRALGIVVDQAEADKIAAAFEVDAVPLLPSPKNAAPVYEWEIVQKVVAVDEARERKGLEPLPGEQGSVAKLAADRAQGIDKTGQVKVTEDEPTEEGGAQEPSAGGESEEP